MCITASVGRLGVNVAQDVRFVQVLLNLNLAGTVPFRSVPENGRADTATISAIETFQKKSQPQAESNGLVETNGATLRCLRDGTGRTFTAGALRAIMVHAGLDLIKNYFHHLHTIMPRYDIATPLRMAHFLAQIGHESGELRWTQEFSSGAAYEGRVGLGNTQPGDGTRFKGRGLIQITGRANYAAYGKARGLDYTCGDSPRLLSDDPATAVDASCWFWKKKGLNELADRDDFIGITRRVNGGTNGLTERGAILGRARFLLT